MAKPNFTGKKEAIFDYFSNFMQKQIIGVPEKVLIAEVCIKFKCSDTSVLDVLQHFLEIGYIDHEYINKEKDKLGLGEKVYFGVIARKNAEKLEIIKEKPATLDDLKGILNAKPLKEE